MLINLKNKINSIVELETKVSTIKNISGKTFLELSDNTGKIKAYSIKQISAIPGQKLNITAKVVQNNNEIELEIIRIHKSVNFLIESSNLKLMQNEFKVVARLIKEAISEKRHVIIRHHDDTDGYTAGFAIEKALLNLIKSDKPHMFYTRNVCRTPFYDYIDALKDLSYFLSAKKYGEKPPLVILTDLGSNDQSINSIKRLKAYDMKIAIIDHHRFDKENKDTVDVFLNPQIYGLGSEICAGMLCCELANYLAPRLDLHAFPAIAGTADKSEGKEYEEYLKLSKLSKDYLIKWSSVIDHETYFLRFPARFDFINNLFSLKQEQVEEIYDNMEKEFKKLELAARKYVQIKQGNGFKFLMVDKTKITHRNYTSSKLSRIAHDLEKGPRITFIMTKDAISFRADQVEFSGVSLMEELKQKFPYALVSGGGHDFAGAIKFVEAAKEEIMDYIFKYLKL
ncbi:hypothetical protein HN789_01860 [archaeon]|mgnify:CR=1 FL=1|jgi:archaea-specific RecJ-like exonuclease|nr:hypothetical protein [archaeon]MBT4022560.1 hypothetical protein [archaeon]MBT4272886.1 hypothetical protein [archaeon]MBT4461686.1 hypothetical protein [archaeon]MBT4857546.1 hypothetical protein [archaeon]